MDRIRAIVICEKPHGCRSTDKEIYTALGVKTIFNGELGNDNELCSILGVEKTTDGKLKYLIKLKTKDMDQNYLIDSYIMRRVYPQMVIKFYEKITTWN